MYKMRHKSIYFLSFVLCLLIAVISFQITTAYTKTVEKEKTLVVLDKQISAEKQRKVDLKEELQFIGTDEFIVQKAREEFKLIREGEILFIQDND